MKNWKNENNSLPNRHALYFAVTGYGKSQILGHNTEIPNKGRFVLWDPARDYKQGVTHYTCLNAFRIAINKAKNTRNFRIGYVGGSMGDSIKEFSLFCRILLTDSILDGNNLTYLICEELAEISKNAGKAPKEFQLLLNQGRKYGLVFHGTTQRPEEIYKTILSACSTLFLGRQDAPNSEKYGKRYGLKPSLLRELEPLHAYKIENNTITAIASKYDEVLPMWGKKSGFKTVKTT